MAKLRLHLDADTSIKALHTALIKRGHDVTRTPCEWIAADASDVEQLSSATAQRRCIFTFNVRDYIALSPRYPDHQGILLAAQRSWTLATLIRALDRVLSESQAANWQDRVRWLNDWR